MISFLRQAPSYGDFVTAISVRVGNNAEEACSVNCSKEEDVESDCKQGTLVRLQERLRKRKGETHINFQLAHLMYGKEAQYVDSEVCCVALDLLSGWLMSLIGLNDSFLSASDANCKEWGSGGSYLLIEKGCLVQSEHKEFQ